MTNRNEKLCTGSAIAAVISLLTTIVLSAPALEHNADAIATTEDVRVHEHRTPPVAGLGPLTVHVWRRGTEVQNRGARRAWSDGRAPSRYHARWKLERDRSNAGHTISQIPIHRRGRDRNCRGMCQRELCAIGRRARIGGRRPGESHPVRRKHDPEPRGTRVSERGCRHRYPHVDSSLGAGGFGCPLQVADSACGYARRMARDRSQRSGVGR